MRLIDLSHTLNDDMPVYPGDEPVSLKQNKFLTEDFYNNFLLTTGLHVGTHIDTPMHMTEDKKTIDEYPINQFCGKAVLLNAYQSKEVDFKEAYESMVEKDDIVLIYTGHSEKYGTNAYYEDYPKVGEVLIKFLIDKKVKMVGIDAPSPDYPPFPIHKLLFKQGIFMIENLCHLQELTHYQSFKVYAFPLKIKADASLLRVVAEVID